MTKKEFIDAKEKARISLEKAYTEKKVDEEIIPILNSLNESNNFYTSSSCAGRIVVMELPEIGDKKGAVFLEKWHRSVKFEEVQTAANKAKKGLLWLLAQSPIFHVGAQEIEGANQLVKTAIVSGFKNSAVKGVGKNIIVEIASTERLDAPIGKDGKLFCSEEHLRLLVDISNNIIEKAQKKLYRLEENLRNL